MRHEESGLTLVELLVTVALSSVVLSVIAASILVGLRTTDETQKRLSESHDAQITAAYFIADVQGSDNVSVTDIGCVETGETPVVSMEWFDGSHIKTVAYFVHAISGERRLSRRLCANDTSTGVTATESVLAISHNLSTSTNPTVECRPSACSPTGTSTPSTLVMTVTDAGGFVFALYGSRRVA